MKLFVSTFLRNEFRTIIGHRMSNFWILLTVFVFAIGALEFSRAGMLYLKAKMDDPFINWIEIPARGHDFDKFQTYMREEEHRQNFYIGEYEENFSVLKQVVYNNTSKRYFEGRTIKHDSRLLNRILDDNNVVCSRDNVAINDNEYGWIVTKRMMELLGYSDPFRYPLFISVAQIGDSANIISWNLEFNDDCIWYTYPIPIIAVVNQLPNMLDFLTPRNYFFQAERSSSQPFNISKHDDYFKDINLVVTDTTGVAANVRNILDECGVDYEHHFVAYDRFSGAFRPASKIRIVVKDSNFAVVNDAARRICGSMPGVCRIYDYAFGNEGDYENSTDYLWFIFDRLNKVSDFADFAMDKYGVRIDMTQIDAKENYKTFNILASVLCVAIMILSALFVMIFLWFLIDSHFKAISRNLGTIMAFGLPNTTIIQIYCSVFFKLVTYSLVIAVCILWIVGQLFDICGLERSGGGHYIVLNDPWVWSLIIIIPILTWIVVFITMKSKLKAKPGDLIFERTNWQ